MRRNGFSLIELLVVIAIIAILAALLFPVFLMAREKGRQTSCGSNLKQLSAAFLMYQESWDEMFPAYHRVQVGKSNNGCTWGCHWSPQLTTYIKTLPTGRNARESYPGDSVLLCPSRSDSANGSYSMNLNLGYKMMFGGGRANRANLANSEPVTLADVKNPSQTVLIFDTVVPQTDLGMPDFWGERWREWRSAEPGDLSEIVPGNRVSTSRANVTWKKPRHSGGNMVSFADGHVKWIRNIRSYTPNNRGRMTVTGTDGFLLE